MKKYKILMVCLGNICRSPLAEGILRDKLPADRFEVDSAGIGSWHVGMPPDRRAQAVGRKHGTDISGLRGRQFSPADFDRFDVIYAMDKSNYRDILSKAQSDADRTKVKLILDELYPGEKEEVPDPYYDNEHGFENVYQMLDEVTDIIRDKLLKNDGHE